MQRFKLADGSMVLPGREFAFKGVQFGSNWNASMNDKQRAAIGLVEVIYDPMPDPRFYFSNENPKEPGKWISTPRDVEQCKEMLVASVKAYVASTLAQTDWMHARALDDAKLAMPEDVKTYRMAVRDHGNALEDEIYALDFDALTKWQPHDWPVDPNAPTDRI